MIELETRELRYFVAIAEELHFGRAAERLAVAQPALSKLVQRLEQRLGVELMRRSSRSVALTAAGHALLEHGRVALAAVASAAERAREAADASPVRLAVKPGGDANLLSGIIAGYADVPGARSIDVRFSGSRDRAAMVRDRRVDVALLYAPFDDLDGLVSETLLEERRVVVLSSDHPLALQRETTMAHLAGEPHARWPGDGAHEGRGPEVADLAELISLVRLGRAVAVLPRSLLAVAPLGVSLVTVSDAPLSRIVIARRADDDRQMVLDLMRAAAASAQLERRSP